MTEPISEKQQNPWISHCKAYMLEHKCNYKEAIKLSRETYQSVSKKQVKTEEIPKEQTVVPKSRRTRKVKEVPIKETEEVEQVVVPIKKVRKVKVKKEILSVV